MQNQIYVITARRFKGRKDVVFTNVGDARFGLHICFPIDPFNPSFEWAIHDLQDQDKEWISRLDNTLFWVIDLNKLQERFALDESLEYIKGTYRQIPKVEGQNYCFTITPPFSSGAL